MALACGCGDSGNEASGNQSCQIARIVRQGSFANPKAMANVFARPIRFPEMSREALRIWEASRMLHQHRGRHLLEAVMERAQMLPAFRPSGRLVVRWPWSPEAAGQLGQWHHRVVRRRE